MKINKNYIIVFTCNKRHNLGQYKRMAVGAKSLHKYIGVKCAKQALQAAEIFKGDKLTIRYRKYGRVEFYSK